MEFVYHPLAERKFENFKLDVSFDFEENEEVKEIYKSWKERKIYNQYSKVTITKYDWKYKI